MNPPGISVPDLSTGLFLRGLRNLKGQLSRAEEQLAAIGVDGYALLNARVSGADPADGATSLGSRDVHRYTLAEQVHWAAEGARLAVAHLLGEGPAVIASEASTFAELNRGLDSTIGYLEASSTADFEAALERTIVIQNPRGSMSARGDRFLVAFAIPHFYYHLSMAYAILRNQGVRLTMGDFLGNWTAS